MRLAFVDHHLANFHADTFLRLLRTTYADRGVDVIAFETDPAPGEDWCAANGVTRAPSVDEAVAGADAVLVLAPDDLETHPVFARQVLPARKPVVFDKLLALDPAAARAIVAEAADLGTRVFSGSALRYAAEVDDVLVGIDPAAIEDVFARGYGRWDHYGIHTLSLAIRLGGFAVGRLRESGTADARVLTLDHGHRRTTVDCRAGDNADKALGWTFGVKAAGRWHTGTVEDFDAFYTNLLRHYLDFLGGAVPESSPDDLARLVAVLAGSDASLAADGAWLDVDTIGAPS